MVQRSKTLDHMDQWAATVFADDSRFSLTSDSRLTFIWERTRDPLPALQYPRNRSLRPRRLDTGQTSSWIATHPHVFGISIVTAERYRDEVLGPFRLFRGAVGPDFLLMDDNARLHGTHMSTNFWKVRRFAGWIDQSGPHPYRAWF
ncbi:uncharacterized protein TNCV_2152751 [Trichonephila clavipes]|nr:uncharacterized protein TNCV_2152751 [Trichonephila clavipes]